MQEKLDSPHLACRWNGYDCPCSVYHKPLRITQRQNKILRYLSPNLEKRRLKKPEEVYTNQINLSKLITYVGNNGRLIKRNQNKKHGHISNDNPRKSRNNIDTMINRITSGVENYLHKTRKVEKIWTKSDNMDNRMKKKPHLIINPAIRAAKLSRGDDIMKYYGTIETKNYRVSYIFFTVQFITCIIPIIIYVMTNFTNKIAYRFLSGLDIWLVTL